MSTVARVAVLLMLLPSIGACGPREEAAAPAVASAPPPTTAPPAEPPPLGRLPGDVHPTRYALTLEIAPDRDRFAGSVEIAVTLDRPRDVVWMHARGITVKRASVQREGSAPTPAELTQVDKGGAAALRLARPIEAGRATISVDFEAAFGSRNESLYRVERGGRYYAATQMEAIFARQAFPCFDEPAFKTPFDITLVVPKGQAAIANTRVIEAAPLPSGMQRVTFATTAPLPTYLVALAVGPYDVVDAPPIPPNAVRKRPLPFRGVAASGRGKDLAYALAETPRILAALEAYTGIEYPFDKLDILAVPDKRGAMENPGAVTFSEPLILIGSRSPGFATRTNFESVMAHELAHQWFGDLVTMTWWDDTWLNESFASWLGDRVSAELYPKDRFDEMAASDVLRAMDGDARTSARRIHEPVVDNDGIVNAFDVITYVKGGAVLRMFESFLGKDTFQRGLRAYLEGHRDGNATEADLLAALSKVAGTDVATPFRTFLDQPGVPFVEARLVCGAGATPRLHVAQSRYLPIGSSGDADKIWQIPLCVRYGTAGWTGERCSLLTTREADLDLKTPDGACPSWVHPNAHASGYYRFTMAPEDVRRLEGAFEKLEVGERVSFASSLFAAFARGSASGDDALRVLPKLARDPNPEVAEQARAFLGDVSRWFAGDPAHAKFEALARGLYAPVLRDLGWSAKGKANDEPAGTKALRATVISTLVRFANDPATRREAAKRGRAYLGAGGDGKIHPDAAPPDFAFAAVACAIDEDEALFDAAAAKLGTVDDDEIRGALIQGLALVKRPALARRARDLTFDPRLRKHEMAKILAAQLDQDDTRADTWAWFKTNADTFFARYPPARVFRIVRLMGVFCDRATERDLEQFLGPRAASFEGAPRALADAVESVRLCAARREAQQAGVRQAIEAGAAGKKRTR